MSKLQFEFCVVTSPTDPKTNTIIITSITSENGDRYVLPEDCKNIAQHPELRKTETYAGLKETIRRHDRKNVWIILSEELKKIYMDEAGNVRFNDYFLDKSDNKQEHNKNENDDNLKKLIEQLIISNQRKNNQKDLKNISEKFLLQKFASKTTNVKQWIETFEKECKRFDIIEDDMMIEILRLFLDKSGTDWYYATIAKLEQINNWKEWKDRMLETFADKGWNTWRYALSFRYKEGSLIDYAMRKERLLLEANKKIDSVTLTAIISAGLPEFIADKIDKDGVTDSTSLFNEIRKYENLVTKKSYIAAKDGKPDLRKKNVEKKPCKTCENLNKGLRYHPEEKCWFKIKENEKDKNNIGRIGSNTVLEVDLNTSAKNE